MTAPQQPPSLGNSLIFHPIAWLELKWFLLHKPVEVSCMGIAEIPDHPLYITRLAWLPQNNSAGFVEFHEGAFSTHLNDSLDAGLQPYQATRIWIHTHPGGSPNPSGQDEDQLTQFMALNDWTVMFIMARTGATFCRLRVREHVTVKGAFGRITSERRMKDRSLDVAVAWSALREPREIDPRAWMRTFDSVMNLRSERRVVEVDERRKPVAASIGKARPKTADFPAKLLPITQSLLSKNEILQRTITKSLPKNLSLAQFVTMPAQQQAAILETAGYTLF